jgi:hypothetical protein
MGNGNCCERPKIINRDFNIEDISSPIEKNNAECKNKNKKEIEIEKEKNQNEEKEKEKEKEKSKNMENKKESEQKTESVIPKNCCDSNKSLPLIISKFDYDNDNKKYNSFETYKNSNKYQKEKNSSIMIKLIRHATFTENNFLFTLNFLENLNSARTNIMELSDKLMNFYINFDLIKNKIDGIKDEKIRTKLTRTKEEFKLASEYYNKLNQEIIKENKENLKPLVEIDDFKLPILSDLYVMKSEKFYEKFRRRFIRKFNGRFILKKIMFEMVFEDPEISFLLFITKDLKKKDPIFSIENKYIAMDYKENLNESIFITIVFAADNLKINDNYADDIYFQEDQDQNNDQDNDQNNYQDQNNDQ